VAAFFLDLGVDVAVKDDMTPLEQKNVWGAAVQGHGARPS